MLFGNGTSVKEKGSSHENRGAEVLTACTVPLCP